MRTKEEVLTEVEVIMAKYVTPNVAQHGGKINVLDFAEKTTARRIIFSSSCYVYTSENK